MTRLARFAASIGWKGTMPDGHVPETPGQAAVVADLLKEHLLDGRREEARETYARLAGYFEEGDS